MGVSLPFYSGQHLYLCAAEWEKSFINQLLGARVMATREPKPGTVWRDKLFTDDQRARVFYTTEDWVTVYLDDCLIYRKMPKADFIKRYEYLGMSKAKPSDLFRVEGEEDDGNEEEN